jgi:hypothetical protein
MIVARSGVVGRFRVYELRFGSEEPSIEEIVVTERKKHGEHNVTTN